MYKALTYINLPPDNRKSPGDSISQEEWEACDPPQTEEDIQALLDQGAISEDMDAPINEAHLPVDPGAPTTAKLVEGAKVLVEEMGDAAPEEIKQLADLDYQHVVAGDAGSSSESVGG